MEKKGKKQMKKNNMKKFSIIIPVHNMEKLIGRCLDSIFNQTFEDYEVIVVNDGSTDNTLEILKKYNIKLINQKYLGVSEARNNAIKKATGKYLIFLDSDDFLSKDLLCKLDKETNDNPDVIRYQVRKVYENGKKEEFNEESFSTTDGVDGFNKIVNYKFIDPIWCYAIKRNYYLKEKFSFKKNTLHEDFGLVPLVIIKASKIKSISYIGYNYYQRNGSIMNNDNYKYTKRKVKDFYNHYKFLIKEIDKTNLNSKIFKSYVSNSLIQKVTELKKEDYKVYLKKLKNDKVYDNILSDSTARKLKKIILWINPKLYFKGR